MRVTQIIDSLTPAGAEQSLVALAPELRRRDVELDVIQVGRDATLAPVLQSHGVPVHQLAAARRTTSLRNVAAVRRHLRARAPDLVHTTLFAADQVGRVAAALAHVPVVSSLVNVAYGDQQLADARLRRWKVRRAQVLDAATARLVARFHAVSEDVAETMARRLWVPLNRIDVIPRGRSAANLGRRTAERATEARRRLGLPCESVIVLAAGRHEYQKGLDVLLRAVPLIASEVPCLAVVVAGRQGNMTAELEQLVTTHADRGIVRLLGARDDVPDLMAAADVFVLPSRWEGLPGSLLEAMALEAPIVASDMRASREVIGTDLALFVPVDDSHALGRAVITTITDRLAAAGRATAARQRFLDHYEIGPIADATVEFYRRALNSSAR